MQIRFMNSARHWSGENDYLCFKSLGLVHVHHPHRVGAARPQRRIIGVAIQQRVDHIDCVCQSTPSRRRLGSHRLDDVQQRTRARIAQHRSCCQKQQAGFGKDMFEQYVGRLPAREQPPASQYRQRMLHRQDVANQRRCN